MRLRIFNGSPRGEKSNTQIMLAKVLEGFNSITNPDLAYIYLSHPTERMNAHLLFAEADLVLLGFPLYTDAMPGLVKEYIDSLAQYVGRKNNPKMAFMVQSGFLEAIHSRFVQRYLE